MYKNPPLLVFGNHTGNLAGTMREPKPYRLDTITGTRMGTLVGPLGLGDPPKDRQLSPTVEENNHGMHVYPSMGEPKTP